jgi:hypothetical protein
VIVGLGGGRGVEATFEVREGRKESDSILYMCCSGISRRKRKSKRCSKFKGSKFKATLKSLRVTELKIKYTM